jgi:multicomponent Na+:H+ antiporter subunit B
VKKVISLCFILALGILLLAVVASMPRMGDPQSPTNTHVIDRYLERAEEETGAENVITGVILNYRGYDTEGEVTVIFTGLAAVLAILGREKRGRVHAYPDRSPVRSSLVVRSAVRFLFPFILLFSLYTVLHGDISPGGGFQGGAVLAAGAFVLAAALGLWSAGRPVPPWLRYALEGAAPVAFFTVGVIGILGGAEFLTYMLPRVAAGLQPSLRTWMTLFIELGIGTGGAMIFLSILMALSREEGEPS